MFSDRRDAGRQLAARLIGMGLRRQDPVVVSLPYGALEVADEVADQLQAPLRLMIARPVKSPGTRTIIGAVAENQAIALDAQHGVAAADVDHQIALETVELYRRSSLLRRWMPPVTVVRRTVVLVDDAASHLKIVHAAIQALRAERPGKVVFMSPVVEESALPKLRSMVDDVVYLKRSSAPVFAPDHYKVFPPVGDEAIQEILRERGM